MFRKSLVLVASVLSCLISSETLAEEVEIPESCNQGVCFQTKYLGKSQPVTTSTGTFYEFEIHDRSWRESSQPGAYHNNRQDYAHCSTQKPAIAFRLDGDPQITVHFLNPGAYPVPETMWISHLYYWMVCNDRIGPFSRLPPSNSVASLGYPLNLDQREVNVESEAELKQLFGVGSERSTRELSSTAEIVLPKSCRGIDCVQYIFMGKTIVEQNALGTQNEETLYQVVTRIRYVSGPSQPIGFESAPETHHVFCSKRIPASIFGFNPSSTDSVSIYYLNPGGEYGTYNYNEYPIYWLTCHNFVGPDFFSERMANQALQLGYSLRLPQRAAVGISQAEVRRIFGLRR